MAATKWMESGTAATGDFSFWASTSGTVTADTTTVRNGNRSSAELSTGSPAVGAQLRSPGGILADAGRRISFWYRTDKFPGSAQTIFTLRDSASVIVATLFIQAGGKTSLVPAGTSGLNGQTATALNTWNRIAVSYTITSTTSFRFDWYVNGALQGSCTTGTLTHTGTDRFRCELPAIVSWNSWHSDFYVDDGNDYADPGPVGVTPKLPNANNVNTWNTAIGTNPANRWTNVNERPLSQTNGWKDSSITPQNENYTLQGANTGDVDVSGFALVARMAWVYAKQETAILGTTQMTDNGSNTTITPTTSLALYTLMTDSASYPSNAAGIGMVSPGLAADPVDMYECGTLIAYLQGPAGKPFIASDAVRHAANW